MVVSEEEVELKNLLDIIYQTINAVNKRDLTLLRDLSNRTLHTASIYKDTDSISVAVIVYSLSKLVGRTDYYHQKQFNVFMKKVLVDLDNGATNLKKRKFQQFHKNLKSITSAINNLDGKLKQYVQETFREAQINKASRLYEHGLSLAETAELFGISVWELSEYVGRTGIPDVDLSLTKSIRERINLAKKLFE